MPGHGKCAARFLQNAFLDKGFEEQAGEFVFVIFAGSADYPHKVFEASPLTQERICLVKRANVGQGFFPYYFPRSKGDCKGDGQIEIYGPPCDGHG